MLDNSNLHHSAWATLPYGQSSTPRMITSDNKAVQPVFGVLTDCMHLKYSNTDFLQNHFLVSPAKHNSSLSKLSSETFEFHFNARTVYSLKQMALLHEITVQTQDHLKQISSHLTTQLLTQHNKLCAVEEDRLQSPQTRLHCRVSFNECSGKTEQLQEISKGRLYFLGQSG